MLTCLQRSTNFQREYEKLSVSVDLAVTAAEVTAGLGFAMSQVSDVTTSTDDMKSFRQNSTIKFQPGRIQVWRVVKKTMSINNRESMTSTDRVYIYDQPASEFNYDRDYWNNQAIEYLNLNLVPPGERAYTNIFTYTYRQFEIM